MRTVAVVVGGDSPEYKVSVKSGTEVCQYLSLRYNVYLIIIRGSDWYFEDNKGRYHKIDKNDFSLIIDDRRIRFDAVFIAIHGTPGENGMLQGYFNMLGIPYTGCNMFCSALTFNKQVCKFFLKAYDIPMADSIIIRKNENPDLTAVIQQLGMPCFVKPNDSGSSFGVTKVKTNAGLIPAIANAFNESDEVMIESYMKGIEVACGILKTRSETIVLPVTEIKSKNEFFDYEAKYTPGRSDEITPAVIPDKLSDSIQQLSKRICQLLDCKGIFRIDFIVVDDQPLFLEVNTVPGMTKESILPKQVLAAGISFEDFYSMAVEDLFE